MFYSEQLLSKTGPLARVWLASNVERKLSKSQILQSDIQTSIGAIVDQGQAPMALRLSGQLMLGVVRIYGRQARYLLDDCNEALLKIRMTFKNSNNHDLPAHAIGTIDLNLPDLLTIDDLFPSMDFAYPLTQQPVIDVGDRAQDFDQDWTSTLNPQQSTQSRLSPDDQPLMNDDDLGLDFGDRDDVDLNDTTVSLQYGRNAPTPRPLGDEIAGGEKLLNEDDDLVLDTGDDIVMDEEPNFGYGDDLASATVGERPTDPHFLGDDETLQLRQAQAEQTQLGAPPLLELGSTAPGEMDLTFENLEDEAEDVVAQQPQRSRKFKTIVPDADTVLHNKQIKAQSEDRSRILKMPSFLPRDPVLLTLMNMQKNGDFVTNAMNDGSSRNWAPELQGLLSFEVVHRSGQLKRKRDSGIGGLSEDEHSEKSPRLEIEDDDMDDEGIDTRGARDQSVLGFAEENGVQLITSDAPGLEDVVLGEDEEGIYGDTFDETTMPLLHPAESGPVSLGTKRAVHLLRDKFGGQSSEASPTSQAKKSVLLQDLVPEGRTSKEDATKMFFEILVLATKDAIKVEQGDKQIGLPLRIRGKRGLWGSWAETSPEDEPEGTSLSQPLGVPVL